MQAAMNDGCTEEPIFLRLDLLYRKRRSRGRGVEVGGGGIGGRQAYRGLLVEDDMPVRERLARIVADWLDEAHRRSCH